MDELAASSRAAYADLLHTEGFIEFFRQATPIDVIEHSRIGSRPARRTGRPSIADLRAIPWVFSWSQARFLLSGWFGLGTALAELPSRDEGRFDELVGHAFDWPPLHYIVSNAATAIATADAEIMGWYADMVADARRSGQVPRPDPCRARPHRRRARRDLRRAAARTAPQHRSHVAANETRRCVRCIGARSN